MGMFNKLDAERQEKKARKEKREEQSIIKRWEKLDDIANGRTPIEKLEEYAKGSDFELKCEMLETASTQIELLDILAQDYDSRIRKGVALHSATLPDTLDRLAADLDEDVQEAARNNSNFS